MGAGGLDAPTTGVVEVAGEDVEEGRDDMEGISVLPSSQGMENLIGALSRMGDDDDDIDDDLDFDFEDDEEDC